MAASGGAAAGAGPQEAALAAEAPAARAALALALVAILSSALLQSWSRAARTLRSGAPLEGVFMVSDDLERPRAGDAVFVRYDPARGALDLLSLPAAAALGGGHGRAGRAYAAALKRDGDPARASADAALALRGAVADDAGAPAYLNLEAEDAAALAPPPSAATAADDAVIHADPALRRAVDVARSALAGPLGPWGLLGRLWNARAEGNLTRYDMAVLALEAAGVSNENVRAAEFPAGKGGAVREDLLTGLWDGPPAARPIQVEVLNGSSQPGAAADVTQYLRGRGVDVVFFGNLGAHLSRSRILDRSGDRTAVRELRALLAARSPEAWTELAPEKLLHASILIGDDRGI